VELILICGNADACTKKSDKILNTASLHSLLLYTIHVHLGNPGTVRISQTNEFNMKRVLIVRRVQKFNSLSIFGILYQKKPVPGKVAQIVLNNNRTAQFLSSFAVLSFRDLYAINLREHPI